MTDYVMKNSWAQSVMTASNYIDVIIIILDVEIANRILLDSERFELKFYWKSEFLIWYNEDVNNTFKI